MSNKVWYASYGSNLNKARFMCYIVGGKPPGAKKSNPGCADRTPPSDSRPVPLELELYFARYSTSWGGAAAFVRPLADSITHGRMYLITDEQFNDVVRQENDLPVNGQRFVPPFGDLQKINQFVLPGNHWYGLLLNVGNIDGSPMITFTEAEKSPAERPSDAYLKVIISGLKETYPAMTPHAICDYLLAAEGIRNNIPAADLVSLC